MHLHGMIIIDQLIIVNLRSAVCRISASPPPNIDISTSSRDPQETETSEFNLTFESDTDTDPESELLYDESESDLVGKDIMMALPHTTAHTGTGYANGGIKEEDRLYQNSDTRGDITPEKTGPGERFTPRRVSLNQLSCAAQDGVVVTKAVVMIG